MNTKPTFDRLAVCSWSLQAPSPEILAQRMALTGINRVQLALDPLLQDPAVWSATTDVLKSHGITIISGMAGCAGEDYTTLETIRLTGGIAPDATWEQNRRELAAKARLALSLGLRLVSFHAGFLPQDESDPAFDKMIGRLREIAETFNEQDLLLALETGQERAQDLRHVLEKVDRPNVRVNFDPANMVLYAKGDPIDAVRLLAPWIAQVHVKDAVATHVRGTWGQEVPVGKGDVDWPVFCATLNDIGYKGDLVIEREAGTQRVADIRTARLVIEQVFGVIQSAEPRGIATTTTTI